ncbi:hypothetical protein [Actinomadura decatromicini]|uniref:SnoaL-like domain-containing protein n=1 Tax=Actinomadura decatromicini TaxID=2604572 RepID=A0A5D3FNC3_9ACTN|nr:hypothetical protein [Actinomadura decatromicini]TYK49426.1 hypothetical protein FXF68_16850 [Actinomadura decatromicini]
MTEERQVLAVLDEVYAAWAADDADAALVFGKGAVVPSGDAEPGPASRSLETRVLSRWDGAWRVESFHSCAA